MKREKRTPFEPILSFSRHLKKQTGQRRRVSADHTRIEPLLVRHEPVVMPELVSLAGSVLIGTENIDPLSLDLAGRFSILRENIAPLLLDLADRVSVGQAEIDLELKPLSVRHELFGHVE